MSNSSSNGFHTEGSSAEAPGGASLEETAAERRAKQGESSSLSQGQPRDRSEKSDDGRLQAVREYGGQGRPSGELTETLDRIAGLAAHLLDAPVGLVTFVGEKRQWHKGMKGTDVQSMRREHSLCTEAIQRREPLVIEDISQEDKHRDNPYILESGEKGASGAEDASRGQSRRHESGKARTDQAPAERAIDLQFRFYAGAPLVTPEGHRLGTVCALGEEPQSPSEAKTKQLEHLAGLAMQALEEARPSGREDSPSDAESSSRSESAPETVSSSGIATPVAKSARDGSAENDASQSGALDDSSRGGPAEKVSPGDNATKGALSVNDGGVTSVEEVVGSSRAEDPGARNHALAEKARRFRQLTESISEVFWLRTEEEMLYVSPSFEEMWGRSRDPLYQDVHAYLEWVHPADRDEVESKCRALVDEERPLDTSYRIVRPSGEVRWLRAQFQPVEDTAPDDRQRFAGAFQDITDRKRFQRALQQERDRLAALLDGLPVSVVSGTPQDGKFIVSEVNASFEETFGIEADQIEGEDLNERIVPERLQEEAAEIDRETLLSQTRQEEVRRLADGELRDFRVEAAVPERSEGEIYAIYTDITDQKRREKALRNREGQLRGLANTVPGVIYQFYARPDGSRGCYFVSDRAGKILDMDPRPNDFYERFLRRVPEEEIDELLETVDRAIEEEKVWRHEFPFDRPDGERIWLVGTAMPESKGDEVVFNGFLLDATRRKQAEDRLKRKNALFEKAQDLADIGAWEYDPERDQFTWTSQVREILGRSSDGDITAEEALSYYHPDDQPKIERAFSLAVKRGRPYDLQLRIRKPDGTIRWVLTHGEPVVEEGRTVQIRGTIQDITERKQREEKLRVFSKMVEQADDGILVTSAQEGEDGEIVYANAAFEDMSGYDASELEGQTVEMLRGPETDSEVIESLRAAMSREETWEGETVNYRKRGEPYLARWTAAPVRGEDGSPLYWVSVQRDVTDRREREKALREARNQAEAARKEAEEASRLKSAMLANMSHEIRTPLTSIIGFAETISDEVGERNGDLSHFAQLIEESGERLLETLDGVLNLSKFEAGHVELQEERIDLAAQAKRAAQEFRSKAEEEGLTLHVEDLDRSDPVWARADQGGVQIVLQNLLSNAVKYTGEGGDIWVRACREGGQALVEVEDTGIGMRLEMAEDLFEPFRQASDGLDREYEGTGIGLALTQRAVEEMGGEIEVESEKGTGSRFTVRLDVWERGPAS